MDEPMLQFFVTYNVPSHLQMFCYPFDNLAQQIVQQTPRNPERTVALRKLLEARDAILRAQVMGPAA